MVMYCFVNKYIFYILIIKFFFRKLQNLLSLECVDQLDYTVIMGDDLFLQRSKTDQTRQE